MASPAHYPGRQMSVGRLGRVRAATASRVPGRLGARGCLQVPGVQSLLLRRGSLPAGTKPTEQHVVWLSRGWQGRVDFPAVPSTGRAVQPHCASDRILRFPKPGPALRSLPELCGVSCRGASVHLPRPLVPFAPSNPFPRLVLQAPLCTRACSQGERLGIGLCS